MMNIKAIVIEIICNNLALEKSEFSINDHLYHTVKRGNGFEPDDVVYGSPRDGLSCCDFECLMIIMDVESEFNVELTDDESADLAEKGTISDLIDLIENKLESS